MSISDFPKYIFITMTDNNEKVVTHNEASPDSIDECIDVTTETVTATSNETPSGKNTSRLRASTRTPPSKGKELFRSPASSTRSKNNRKRTATSPATTTPASNKKKTDHGRKGKSKKTNVNLKPPPVDVTYEADKKKMIELEEHAVQLVDKLSKDNKNIQLQLETRAAERLFRQSLFVLKSRNGPGISWAGWTSEYCKEIQVSAYGEEYAKTREYKCYISFI